MFFPKIPDLPATDIPESAKITSQKPEAGIVLQEILPSQETPEELQKNPKISRLQKFLTILYQLNRLPTFRLRKRLMIIQEQSHPISQIILLKVPIVLKTPALLYRKKMQKTEKTLPNFPPSPMVN